MSKLIEAIKSKNFVEAEKLFNERIETIAEQKVQEKKREITAKIFPSLQEKHE